MRGRPGYPDRSSWGLWGDTDQVGAFNDVTPEDVADAARLVTDGAVFALNWDQRLPDPALYTRGTLTRTVIDHGGALDDYYDDFWPQQSSQWDGLAHIRHPRHGFYGGREAHELRGPDARNGIEHWARRGIAARFVLADVDRWRASTGRPLHPDRGEGVPATDVIATLEAQAVELRPGAVLLLRFGWITWYEQLDQPARDAVADPAGGWTASGLRADTHMLRWLWDSGVVAVAADNPAVEAVPAGPGDRSLHTDLLTLLGVALGELWYLDRLAAHCAATGRYTGLLASAPMHLAGGVGSPANALALM
ncbi:cyclase family protein [Dactylosporangium sp. NPDC005572]|uniref:cyclase family protein n=1 Tax=Dactylosporangium sp. NPDC005572 TaxID=3156889 RepID=UPI0033ADCC88